MVPPGGPQPGLRAAQAAATDEQPPARPTRAISSSQKRSIAFWVFADLLRRQMCRASRVSARVARIGW